MKNKSHRVENIGRKGEIACFKQFLLFHNVFHSYISLLRQIAALFANGLIKQGCGVHCTQYANASSTKAFLPKLSQNFQGETLIASQPAQYFVHTVKPVLETTGIKRPPALRDHCSDTTSPSKIN